VNERSLLFLALLAMTLIVAAALAWALAPVLMSVAGLFA
jgi:hypothetical protein